MHDFFSQNSLHAGFSEQSLASLETQENKQVLEPLIRDILLSEAWYCRAWVFLKFCQEAKDSFQFEKAKNQMYEM